MLRLGLSLLLLPAAMATSASGYSGPTTDHMWVMGADGVHVYSADGETVVSALANTEFCKEATSRGKKSQSCSFKDAVFDGSGHVWASNTQGGSFVEVFNAKTGAHVKSQPTCGFPWDVDNAPHRDEVWVHCWSPEGDEGDTGHVDVYSTTDINKEFAQIAFLPELESHGHGQIQLDASAPNYAYGTLLDTPGIFKIDAETKKTVATLPIPLVNGFYRTSFSPMNQHMFLRAYVCCSCGVNADTRGACSTRGGGPKDVAITTGPSAGTTAPGSCGHGCEGSLADTIGVIEYDVVAEKQVASHNDHKGLGGNPYTSPLGDYTVILSNDGASVRVLQSGANGASSTDKGTIELGFAHGGTAAAVSDVSFVEDATHNIAIFAATTDNFIVLVDMDSFLAGTTRTKRIDLQPTNTASSSGHGRGATRQIEWARGTDYVWVNSAMEQTIQIIKLAADGDIEKAAIVKELKEASSSRLVYVGPSSYGRPGLSTVVIAVIIAAGAGALIAVLIICVCCKKSNLSKKPKGAIG